MMAKQKEKLSPIEAPDKHIQFLRSILDQVTDPEIPVLTINEMGILRDVAYDGETVLVTITPTYSGCPAMHQISEDVGKALAEYGYAKFRVSLVLSPAWTTDWMSEDAKQKLLNYGISPPCKTSALDSSTGEHALNFSAACPQCKSLNTTLVSEFGSTACKALWKCKDCLEPFDYFKPI
jgi:ring-1,2-phenylacetyl-CoA epoxidase subunit PaaD